MQNRHTEFNMRLNRLNADIEDLKIFQRDGIIDSTEAENRYNDLKKREKELKLREIQECHIGKKGKQLKLNIVFDENRQMYRAKRNDGVYQWGKTEEAVIDGLLRFYNITEEDYSFGAIWLAAEKQYEKDYPERLKTIELHWSDYKKYISEELSQKDIRKITKQDIKDYLLDYLTTHTIRKQQLFDIKGVFNLAFDYAIETLEIINSNPAQKVDNKLFYCKTDQSVARRNQSSLVLTENDCDHLFDKIDAIKHSERAKTNPLTNKCYPLMATVQRVLGLRPGELVALKWDDIDGEYLHIRGYQQIIRKPYSTQYVSFTKNEKGNCTGGRYLPLPVIIKNIFDEAREIQHDNPSEFIFVDCNGQWCNRERYTKWLSKQMKAVDIEVDGGSYTLRRGANVQLAKAGYSAAERANLMGHSESTNMKWYNSSRVKFLDAAAESLNEIYSNN